jgi:hypothetical protein
MSGRIDLERRKKVSPLGGNLGAGFGNIDFCVADGVVAFQSDINSLIKLENISGPGEASADE